MSLGSASQQNKLEKYKVVVAYDFGTTYSGAAYAFTHSTTPEVFDIIKWYWENKTLQNIHGVLYQLSIYK